LASRLSSSSISEIEPLFFSALDETNHRHRVQTLRR
jgi:hypothetical protein